MKDNSEHRLYSKRITVYNDFQNNLEKYLKTNNSIYLKNVCFKLEMSIEFLLKDILQYFNINNSKNLNKIEDLFDSVVNNCPTEFKLDDSLLNYSNILNNWKDCKNIYVSLSLIRNVDLIYKNIEKTFIEYRNFYKN